ncbi:conjugal transfer protein TraU, partial [Salmonella enterica subsp. enterica serovar Enteritidis]|nr:conjugal transfer protein TraU [Salmonella enterica subsp. enterica serovar Enteritidis]
MKRYLAGLGLMLLCLTGMCGTAQAASAECEGNFVNPITDVCWECIFPVTIGNVPVVKGRQPDTPNPSMPIQFCPMGILYRVGLAIGYWEPMALTDVTRSPYCMVNLGG